MNIIITGSSKGMGKTIAEKFASHGNTLFLCARNETQLKETAEEIRAKYKCEVHYKAFDTSIKEQAIEFGNWCLQFGVPDILVNNAGQFVPGSIYNEADGLLEKMLNVNLFSAYHVTRTVLPKMMERKSGHIFNTCSIASLNAYANGGSYSISKFATLGFSKNLREELKPHNIKVTHILPGAVYTESWYGSGVDEKRMMQTNDIADMVYAASQLSVGACVEEIIIRPQLGDI